MKTLGTGACFEILPCKQFRVEKINWASAREELIRETGQSNADLHG